MNIEELQLILDMVGTATDGAQTIVFVWLALWFIKNLLGYFLGGAAIFAAFRLLQPLVISLQQHLFLLKLREKACPDTAYGSITQHEQSRILEAVERGLHDHPTTKSSP